MTEKTDPKTVNGDIRKKLQALKFHSNYTIVDKIFGGHLVSTVVCEICHNSSQIYEPFLDLSLPLVEERTHPPTSKQKQNQRQGGRRISSNEGDGGTLCDNDLAENVSLNNELGESERKSKHQLRKEKQKNKLERRKNKKTNTKKGDKGQNKEQTLLEVKANEKTEENTKSPCIIEIIHYKTISNQIIGWVKKNLIKHRHKV